MDDYFLYLHYCVRMGRKDASYRGDLEGLVKSANIYLPRGNEGTIILRWISGVTSHRHVQN